jgi:hypothetical protein
MRVYPRMQQLHYRVTCLQNEGGPRPSAGTPAEGLDRLQGVDPLNTVDNDSAAAFQRFAEGLALLPDVIAAILAEHTANGDGLCRRCGRPGYGTPVREHPCGPAALALAALAVRKRTGKR